MPPRTKLTLTGIIGTTAAVMCLSLTGGSEGVRLAPYSDTLGGGVDTVCYGDTGVPMRRYTLPECKAMLATRLANYAAVVRGATPGFDSLTDGQKVAAIDFAYNAGTATWLQSSMRRLYTQKEFPAACEAFLKYRYTDHNTIDCSRAGSGCEGLMTRRRHERAACLGELTP